MKDIEYIKVEGHSHLVRDDSSHGIVNTDIENWLDDILFEKNVFITPGKIFGSNKDCTLQTV